MPKFGPRPGSRPSPNANLPWRNDGEGPDQLWRPESADLRDDLGLRRVRQTGKPQQDHSRMYEALPKDQFTEILVRGHENGAPGIRLLQNLFVNNTGGQLGHVDNIMVVVSKTLHHGPLDALIPE